MKKQIRQSVILLVSLLLTALPFQSVFAVCANGVQSCSGSYGVDQSFFGSGGELNACSSGPAGYCSKQTAGELGVGKTCSAGAVGYCAYAGFNTTDVPFIEFVVTANTIDLGTLSTGSVATATGTFSVRAWQAGGYSVTTASDPPKNNTYTLNALSSPTASTPGTEQFGINLVKNTNFCGAGCHLGADPLQIPDNTFSFGQAATGYNTANQFKYVKGDVIALSTQSTSVTTYTVSYIFNIKPSTAGGTYTFRHILVATGTY